jgi:hypothetical protein
VTLLVPVASAQDIDDDTSIAIATTYVLRPYCPTGEEDGDDDLFGELPEFDTLVVNPGEGLPCPRYDVEDPLTLRTRAMRLGEILDLEIIIENPDLQDIAHPRVWLSYDPQVLEGLTIEVDDDFPEVTPGEEDFDAQEGFVMIDAYAEEGAEPFSEEVSVAHIQFRVIDAPAGGTIISFYDVQESGRTSIGAPSETTETGENILEVDPSSLHVVFTQGSNQVCTDDLECSSGSCVQGVCTSNGLPIGEACTLNNQCASGVCTSGVCAVSGAAVVTESTEPTTARPVGSACTLDSECASLTCVQGLCRSFAEVPNGDVCAVDEECVSFNCASGTCQPLDGAVQGSGALLFPVGSACTASAECESQVCELGRCKETTPTPVTTSSTAFALLQVQNLRVTTEGSNVFLGWDAMSSSQLKGYNVYYGTTMGTYIQRKTVDAASTNHTIRSLPQGTTYYFAVRAISTTDEESAFSQEVAVTVGDPKSSTAPLASVGGGAIVTGNPVAGGTNVPGETGLPSALVLFLVSAAIIGTLIAARRQALVVANHKHS